MSARTRVGRELRDRGLLLVTDPVLPSVCTLVAGGPIRGSWWAHPKAHEIYRVLEGIGDDEALAVKLVSKKQTLVHRSLWPELFAVATSGEDWQTSGLDSKAKVLWKRVERQDTLPLDRKTADHAGGRKVLSARARALEERLLVYATQVHTESGAHEKVLTSWTHLASGIGVRLGTVDVGAARAVFEERTPGRLPWPQRGKE